MAEKNFDNNNENCIEWISGNRTCTVTFTQQKYVTKLKKLQEQFPDDFTYIHENQDGSVVAKIPLKWIKLNNPKRSTREYTEEEKQALRERLANARKAKNGD